MSVNNSPNMNLPVPAVGIEPGPAWAQDINNSLTIIDSHNHAPGSGVQITPAGINVNVNLPFNTHSATGLLSTQFVSQATAITPFAALYVQGNELFYNDLSGAHVQLTKTGSPNSGTGNISGLTSPASASYASSTFVFQSNANTAANIDGASILLRLATASSPALTISPPSSMTTSYSLVAPALPSSTLPLVLDTSGNITASQVTLAQLTSPVIQALNPTGTVIAYAGTTTPAGYLLCDGSAISRATYAALFTAIATNFGVGDGSTTFNLPQLLGAFVRGTQFSFGGGDPDYLSRGASGTGGNTGANVGSYQQDAIQGHVHGENVSTNGGSGADHGITGTQTNGVAGTNPTLPTSGPLNDGTNGVPRIASQTRPLNVYLTYIIKT